MAAILIGLSLSDCAPRDDPSYHEAELVEAGQGMVGDAIGKPEAYLAETFGAPNVRGEAGGWGVRVAVPSVRAGTVIVCDLRFDVRAGIVLAGRVTEGQCHRIALAS